MYEVYFYNLGRAQSKVFETLHDAVTFSVYKVRYGECGEIVKVN